MRVVPEDTVLERSNSLTELPTYFPRPSGVVRFTSGGQQHDLRHHRRRNSMVRRASILRFSPVISTEDSNRDDDAPLQGPYAHLRRKLDYTYHAKYRKERQWLQDSIIDDILEANLPDDSNICVTPTEPWLLFTVGPRGAGKKHVINTLVKDGKLPLLSFVRVDPDEIRRRLPEFETYHKKSPCLVDELTRKESGYIAEVLLLAALQNGRNVVFDCSIRDPEWYRQLVEEQRRHYSSLKTGLIHITAPTKALLQRAKKNYLDSGRNITHDAIASYVQQISKSVDKMKPFVEFHCRIHNDEERAPELLGMEWDDFFVNFLQTCAWKRGMNGKQNLVHEVSEEEKSASRRLNSRRAQMEHRSFCASLSSEENNRTDDLKFYGKYSHIRETLDYSYHSNYTFERQKLQDAIVDDMLDEAIILDEDGKIGSVPTKPWIVFTAGAMGSGKSYTMNVLVEKGRFPLWAFVTVDPDEIRHLLPEYHIYIDENPENAGELTRKEAGFIAEILTLAALQAGKNVLLDGSLRDADWYESYFARLRNEFPSVRQAILHITAPRESVFKRAAHRAETTGRIVPEETLEKALEQVPRSVKRLAPLVDYYAQLNNADEVELIKPDGSTWEDFRDVWNQNVAYDESGRKKILKVLGRKKSQDPAMCDAIPSNSRIASIPADA